MFKKDPRIHVVVVLLFVAIVSGCGAGNPQMSTGEVQSPAAAANNGMPLGTSATPAQQIETPAPSAMTATGSTLASTTGSTAPTDVPTAVASSVAAPTASAFPLQAGWWDNAVCYEVFVRSFYDSDGNGIGDLNGLIAKLDYINDGDPAQQRDLGANCIWLMPVAESDSYHGYDVVDYYRVEQDYGTNEDFKRLVTEARQRGIRVIVDLVLNHTSNNHPWFQEALTDPSAPHRDWYVWSDTDPGYKGPWGDVAWHRSPARDEYYYGVFWSGMPDLDYRNPAVTAEAEKISAFWLNEMGVDGFRLDAIKHLIEDGRIQENTPETHAWLRNYREFLQRTKPDSFTIGEIFGGNPLTLAAYYPDQLDAYFQFEIGQKLIGAAGIGAAEQFMTAVTNADTQLPSQRWAPFLTNHDQPRVMQLFGGNVERAKIAATALLTLPGLPFLYYGEEIGMVGAKPDENIRTPMQWTAEDAAGFTTGQPWRAPQSNYGEVNVAGQDNDTASLLNLYRRLVHLHTSEPALGQGSFHPFKTSTPGVAAFKRQTGPDTVVVVLNFGKDQADNVALSVGQSELAPGTYRALPLLGDTAGAPLTVGDGGALDNYVPLPVLAPKTGYIFKLEQ